MEKTKVTKYRQSPFSRRQFVRVSGATMAGLSLGSVTVNSNSTSRNEADLLLLGAIVVTMDPKRRVFRNGAIAIKGGSITEVGSSVALLSRWQAARRIDLSGLIATPGLINAHIHLTGDNLFPGLEPDDSSLASHMAKWVLPPYEHSRPEDERAAARFVALQMLRQGTTAFIEAATCRFPEAVLNGLGDMGIRGSIGVWAGDLWPDSGVLATATDQAI